MISSEDSALFGAYLLMIWAGEFMDHRKSMICGLPIAHTATFTVLRHANLFCLCAALGMSLLPLLCTADYMDQVVNVLRQLRSWEAEDLIDRGEFEQVLPAIHSLYISQHLLCAYVTSLEGAIPVWSTITIFLHMGGGECSQVCSHQKLSLAAKVQPNPFFVWRDGCIASPFGCTAQPVGGNV